MKKCIVLLIGALFIAGCDEKEDRLPNGFNDMPRPVVIVSCNEGGIIIMDAKQNLHVWDDSYYFVKPLTKSELKAGDVLLPVRRAK